MNDRERYPGWHIWRRKPKDNHTWAFYYFCRKRGPTRIKHNDDGTVDIAVKITWRNKCQN